MPRQPRHAERRSTRALSDTRPASATRRAIIYTRVSTDEQADRGYSLRDQEAKLREHCRRDGVEVLAHFQDDHSAKTFDRPAWTRLRAFLAAAPPGTVDVVLVVKWDRFSRNATDALSMIRTLDDLGVRVQAVDQPIDSIDEVPEQLLMLSFYVAAPEVENRRRSMATKSGMRRAMREGRYVNVPPKGYQRGRDEGDRYLIRPCPEQAPFVTEGFRLAAETETSLDEIRRRLVARGFVCSKNQFTLLLRNPVYAGRLVIPAWRGEPEEIVDALHTPLVSRATFEAVQERRFRAPDARSKARRRLVDELPLRGHLLCPRSFPAGDRVVLTGSRSKSRAGHHVWYYHGQGRGAVRFQADAAHEAFGELLETVAVPRPVATLWRRMAEEEARAGAASAEARLRESRRALAEIEERLAVVDERYHVTAEMDAETYDRLRRRYQADAERVRARVAEHELATEHGADRAAAVATLASNLPDLWEASDAEGRGALAGSIWPAGLVFDGESYRTTPPSPVIALFSASGPKRENASPPKEAGVLSGSPGRI